MTKFKPGTIKKKDINYRSSGTKAKNLTTCKSANKPSTSCVARLIPSCQQVWNKLLTICNKLVDISDLLQGCSIKSDTVMI